MALDSARYRAAIEDYRGLVRHPGALAALPNRAGKPLHEIATKCLRKRHKKILKAGPKIGTHSLNVGAR